MEKKLDYMYNINGELELKNVDLEKKCRRLEKELEKKNQECSFLILELEKLEKKRESTMKKKMLLTDAGQYVIRFGDVNPGSKTGPAKMIKDLEIGRPLGLAERAVAVALAVSLDNDYFSRHGGWGIPFLVVSE
ncbi:scramblase-like protein [Thalictrum thalictroides]|uniref:Phospholipid scramblase n=1 Tax=Thalictrum thalictroides TaxID=46969 RepID=A0A7J6V0L7_THATH|nr:scramblase-like protein [Thalictrum thalictroides]